MDKCAQKDSQRYLETCTVYKLLSLQKYFQVKAIHTQKCSLIYFWCRHKYSVFHIPMTDIHKYMYFKEFVIFYHKHICVLWHLYKVLNLYLQTACCFWAPQHSRVKLLRLPFCSQSEVYLQTVALNFTVEKSHYSKQLHGFSTVFRCAFCIEMFCKKSNLIKRLSFEGLAFACAICFTAQKCFADLLRLWVCCTALQTDRYTATGCDDAFVWLGLYNLFLITIVNYTQLC